MSRRRVVVTGLGCVSPVGNTVAESWANLLAGKPGIDLITQFDASNFACKFAGEVKGFNIADYIPEKEARHMDRFIHLGLAAACQAVADSGLPTGDALGDELATRIGCNIGSGIGGLPMIEVMHSELVNRGPRRISPFFVPASIINMISGHVSIKFGFKGPNIAVVTACTTGLHAIGLSARFVLGEGGGVVVLEEYEHAKARGAKIYAEVAGFGMSADAYHMTAPDIDGPRRSMVMALKNAGVNVDQVGYLNAHGTSTPLGDLNETNAIKATFGDHAKSLVVSSTKSMTGHLLGGAGGIESVFTVLALHHQKIPPTINIFNQDPECDLDYCANTARDASLEFAVKNNFGFGGTNGTLVFKRA
jgi:3-oxoacyl-[acyl-carrier-protein] synthase II